jgi:anti-sigma-K factor RskA
MEHNEQNKNPVCGKIELLADDYLEGMLSDEDRKKMEQHIAQCGDCKKYLEETLQLLEKAVLASKNDKLLANDKKQKLWSNIEAKITPAAKTNSPHIYNMGGVEDKHTPAAGGAWGSIRYYISGVAAVILLAFIIYGVNQFIKRPGENNFVTGNVIEIGGPKWMVTPIKGSPMINNMVINTVPRAERTRHN